MNIKDRVNRKLTERFVDEHAVSIALTRPTKIQTLSGGYAAGPGELIESQTFSLVVADITAPQVMTSDGNLVTPSHILVGYASSDVKRDDSFVLNGNTYVVLQVTQARESWATRATVMERKDA